MQPEDNITLVGMPGVGKSTAGVLLAKALGYSFLDTDIVLQTREGRKLQDIIDQDGLEAFLFIEERTILSLSCHSHVIATGGSVVYRPRAMAHLKAGGVVCHLDLPPTLLAERLDNLNSRGIAMPPGTSIESLYDERRPLYRRYADHHVSCRGLTPQQTVHKIIALLKTA